MTEAVQKKRFDLQIPLAVILLAAGIFCFIFNGRFGEGVSAEAAPLIPVIILFVAGLGFLIKGGDWFVDGATSIAERFKVPEILIGATVVSIGTTLPEVMVSAQAAAKGNSGISYGNAIGSIICNAALIAAITLAVKPAKAKRKSLIIPIVFFFLAAGFYAFNAYVIGEFKNYTGFILLGIFLVYMFFTVRQALAQMKSEKTKEKEAEEEAQENNEEEEKKEPMPIWKALLFLVIGAAIIAFGATLLVDNGTILATKMKVPSSVIALTFVALGTSLPELVTAITSLAKGHGALSLGNIIGANLFNLVLVSGLAISIHPFEVPSEKTFAGINASLLVDIPLVFLVMIILTFPALFKQKLYRIQGILLLLIYAAYMAFQFLV